jgi:hypothetical protein
MGDGRHAADRVNLATAGTRFVMGFPDRAMEDQGDGLEWGS